MVKSIIKALLSIVWVVAFVFIGVTLFMDINGWAGKLLIDQNITTNEKFTGGEIARIDEMDEYMLVVHEAVYEGVFRKSTQPFVQIDLLGLEELPNVITCTLDITGDGVDDIEIQIDKKQQSVEYVALRDDIRGLLDKGSLAGLRTKVSENIYDGLFYYHNKEIDEVMYKEAFSIRVMFD